LPEKNYDSDKERDSSRAAQNRKSPNKRPVISKRIPEGEGLDEI